MAYEGVRTPGVIEGDGEADGLMVGIGIGVGLGGVCAFAATAASIVANTAATAIRLTCCCMRSGYPEAPPS